MFKTIFQPGRARAVAAMIALTAALSGCFAVSSAEFTAENPATPFEEILLEGFDADAEPVRAVLQGDAYAYGPVLEDGSFEQEGTLRLWELEPDLYAVLDERLMGVGPDGADALHIAVLRGDAFLLFLGCDSEDPAFVAVAEASGGTIVPGDPPFCVFADRAALAAFAEELVAAHDAGGGLRSALVATVVERR